MDAGGMLMLVLVLVLVMMLLFMLGVVVIWVVCFFMRRVCVRTTVGLCASRYFSQT